jgi:integrase
VHAILASVARIRPELTAFFACLYYAAPRPEEAVTLRSDLVLPAHGWGKLILTGACPRTGSAWTSTGTSHEPRGQHHPDGAIRIVPIPPILAALLRRHLRRFGTTPDGRLFRGTHGGMLSESVYGRTWHTARDALGPALAATVLARRAYDLRHAALSFWLNATGAPAEVAARTGNSVRVVHTVYTHCLHGQQDVVSQQIEHALRQQDLSLLVTASGSPHRRHHREPVRHMSVNGPQPPPSRTASRPKASPRCIRTSPDVGTFPQLRW